MQFIIFNIINAAGCTRKTKYMITDKDVMEELDISKPAAHRIILQLNSELQMASHITVRDKIPRTFWNEKF